MSYRIGVDIGGTFTDCVVVDGDARRTVAKSLTTHGHLLDGVVDVLRAAAGQLGVELRDLLAQTSSFVHGTTVATNAVLTRTGARTGLITTKGHEGTLPIGKVQSHIAGLSERDIVHLSALDKPTPIVPRELIRGVTERVDSDGDVVVPLDEAEARAAVDDLVAAGVEALAICFLWSFVNPRHEEALQRIVAERAPDVVVSASHLVSPVLGEYERTVTTVLNVYVAPKVNGYLRQLEARLQDEGLAGPLLVMQSNGGLTSVQEAARVPLVTLDSGPTGGVLGSRHLGALYGEGNLICTDVGGTSFDVGLVLGGALRLEAEPVVSQHRFRLSKVAVASIGAGGGSVAWVDEGGLLRVGPDSVGSIPGPACYGRGGTSATVTDADVVLGYIDPDFFLGGRMRLDRGLAMAALERLGSRLAMEPEDVALGIFRITNAQMADLIRRSTIEQGHDPRECVLVAYGGAGATHAAFYGRDVGAKRIVIQPSSTAFSAAGMLTCDVVHVAEASHLVRSPFDAAATEALGAQLARLQADVIAQFEREGTPAADVEIEWVTRARYYRQAHTVDVTIEPRRLSGDAMADLRDSFERRYASLYGAGAVVREGRLELVMLRVTGTRRLQSKVFAEEPAGGGAPPTEVGTRTAHFESHGFVDVPIFRGDALRPGDVVMGPAIVERMGDSVVVPPGYRADVDRYMSLTLVAAAERDAVRVAEVSQPA